MWRETEREIPDAIVKNRFNGFQSDCMSVVDEPRLGAPKTTTTKDNVTEVHDFVLVDHQLKLQEIPNIIVISKNGECHILLEILSIRKLSDNRGTARQFRSCI